MAALYAQDQIALAKEWKLVGGLRYDYFKVNFEDRRTLVPAVNLARTDIGYSPRAGLIWTPTNRQTYYVSYSYAFLPSAEQLGLVPANVNLEPETAKKVVQPDFFPVPQTDTHPIVSLSRSQKGRNAALTKAPGGNDNFYPEGRPSYTPSFKLGRGKSALANLPADTESFPVSTWFRGLLEKGVQSFVLNSQVMQKPSPRGLRQRFETDGSNLPWVIAELRKDEKRFRAWLAHVQTALEDIKDIDTFERPEDKHRYLIIEYTNGAKVPSWLASDGTLRLLTLTIPAYLPDLEGTFLIEEPENGIHPRAIETVLQSLSSIYRSQVLVATHSPVALNMLEPCDVLCFAKDAAGATDIVSGDRHPALRDWKKGEPDLGVLFAMGILS